MPNPEHLAILKEEVGTWVLWRAVHPEVIPDLQGADLEGLDLRGANLEKADLLEANLRRVNLERANLRGAALQFADLRGANLKDAILEGAILQRANLEEANLHAANLQSADLRGATLFRAFLPSANLADANLKQAGLALTFLSGADLSGADLSEVDLQSAILLWANLRNANIERALIGGTVFDDTDLTDTKGLDRCLHPNSSPIDPRTLARNPHLPTAFLRGCGLPDFIIDNVEVLRGDPIQYYSCFISYSNQDDAFAKRLHADLQDNGVRCWFAPEHMKTGDRIRRAIHDAIRLHDKLLLILSEASVSSQWVEDEVERALEKERRDKSTVLFPIRLDDSVMEIDRGWPVTLRNSRHIGDFRLWKDHDAYRTSFDRLLRDLKAG